MEGLGEEAHLLGEPEIVETMHRSFESQFERIRECMSRTEEQLLSRIDDLQKSVRELRDAQKEQEKAVLESNNLVNSLALASHAAANSLALASHAAANLKRSSSPGIAAHLQSLDFFLTADLLSTVCTHSICRFLVDFCTAERIVPNRPIRIMLFAPAANERRRARQTIDGVSFIDVRLKILKNLLFNCRKLASNKDFMESGGRRDVDGLGGRPGQGGSAVGVGGAGMKAPKWLDKSVIAAEDTKAFKKEIMNREFGLESERQGASDRTSSSSRAPSAKRRRLSQSRESGNGELGREILRSMWKRGTDWFSIARMEARRAFTLQFGFIFLSYCDPICTCVYDRAYEEKVSRVPKAARASGPKGVHNAVQVNVNALKALNVEYSKLQVDASFNVEVFQSEVEKNDITKRGEVRRLSTTISIVDAAVHFAVAYFQCASVEDFLGRSEHSLRLVFLISLSFSAVLSEVREKLGRECPVNQITNLVKDYGLINPQDGPRNTFISQHVLRKTEEQFRAANCNILRERNVEVFTERRTEIDSEDEDVEDLVNV